MVSKTINQYSSLFCPDFVRQKYPQFERFIKALLYYIDESNITGYFDTVQQKKANSIYKNIVDLTKFGNIDDIPIENKSILLSYYINWATTFSYASYRTQFQDDEYLRQFIKFSNILYRLKGSYKAYDFFIKLIQKSIVDDINVNLYFEPYFNTHNVATNPPEFYSVLTVASAVGYADGEEILGLTTGATGVIRNIDLGTNELLVISTSELIFVAPENVEGQTSTTVSACSSNVEGIKNDHIIYTELPVYYLDEYGYIQKYTKTNADKGKTPFKFQVVSSSKVLNDYNFIQILRDNLKPAGFDLQIYRDNDEILISILEYGSGIVVYNIQEVANINLV